jgi:hypothetical protein
VPQEHAIPDFWNAHCRRLWLRLDPAAGTRLDASSAKPDEARCFQPNLECNVPPEGADDDVEGPLPAAETRDCQDESQTAARLQRLAATPKRRGARIKCVGGSARGGHYWERN